MAYWLAPLIWLLLPLRLAVADSDEPAAAPLRAGPLSPFTAHYDLMRNALHLGEATLTLERIDGGYRYALQLIPQGIVSLLIDTRVDEESRFILSDGRPLAHRYRYHRHGSRKQRLVEQRFEWRESGDGVVTNTINGDDWQLELPAGSFDKLLYQVAIMVDLDRGQRTMEYPVADGGTLKHYAMEVVASEEVATPLGRFDTLRLERIKRNSRRVTRLWCAPALAYLPVRIEQTEKGEQLSMELRELSGR